MVALHHVDVPWRPADLEQREGRILRQGNQNDEVDIFNYVTESSYDTVMWQKVQAKTVFIEQMRRNEVLDTEIEDLSGGDIGAAAAETKAIATGDPRYLRQVELDDDVRRLTALERAHQRPCATATGRCASWNAQSPRNRPTSSRWRRSPRPPRPRRRTAPHRRRRPTRTPTGPTPRSPDHRLSARLHGRKGPRRIAVRADRRVHQRN